LGSTLRAVPATWLWRRGALGQGDVRQGTPAPREDGRVAVHDIRRKNTFSTAWMSRSNIEMSMNAKALPASDPSPTGAFRPFPRWLLFGMVGLGAAALLFLVAGGLDRFSTLVSTPDTAMYVNVARGFAEGHFVPSVRTPGYPLFLAPAYFLGGTRFGPVFAIVLQLALNLVFV